VLAKMSLKDCCFRQKHLASSGLLPLPIYEVAFVETLLEFIDQSAFDDTVVN